MLRDLAAWWATARSTYTWNRIEAVVWVAFGLTGVAVPALRASIPVLFFISCYANSKASSATAGAAKMDMRHEEAGA